MTTALTMPALKRLAAIMERTASPFEAERLTALSLAKQMLDAAGMAWSDVLHAEPPAPVVVRADRTWRQCAEECLYDHTQALSEWEQGYLQDAAAGASPKSRQPCCDALLRSAAWWVGKHHEPALRLRSRLEVGGMSGSGPHRFTYRRGQRKPANAFCCGRPGAFGNPFKAETFGRAYAVALHSAWLSGESIPPGVLTRAGLTPNALSTKRAAVVRRLPELRGRDLGCYCPQPAPGEPDLCHAATLIELANIPGGGVP